MTKEVEYGGIKFVTRPTPTGRVIFCDDIRVELGDKISYMGVYNGAMAFRTPFPNSLPKLSLSITYVERPNESDEEIILKGAFLGTGENVEFLNASLDEYVKARKSPPPPASITFDPVLSAELNIAIETPQFKSEGLIIIYAARGGKNYYLGAIAVVYSPE